MSYTPPDNNSIDFEVDTSSTYTAPSNTSIDFTVDTFTDFSTRRVDEDGDNNAQALSENNQVALQTRTRNQVEQR